MNSPQFLPQTRHTLARLGIGREMEMRQLRDGVAHGVVEGAAFGNVPAFHVCRRNVHLGGCNGGCQRFEAVTVDDKRIRRQLLQRLADPLNAGADSLSRACKRVGGKRQRHARGNRKAIAFDLSDRPAELCFEMRAGDDEGRAQRGMRVQRLQYRILQAVFATRRREYGNRAWAVRQIPSRSAGAICQFAGRSTRATAPNTRSRSRA